MKKLFAVAFILFSISFTNAQENTVNTVNTIELNSGWKFKQTDKSDWLPAAVPGCVHTDLLINRIIEDPFYRTNEKNLQWIDKADWEYETEFTPGPEILNNDHNELIFKGLDTYAEVYLNEIKILAADNMFREWKVDCTGLLLDGPNKLRIVFNSPVKIDLPKLKALGYALPASNDQSENGGLGNQQISIFARKAPYHYGWDWGPRFVTSGIWRPVYLRGWSHFQIENVRLIQNSLTDKLANLIAQVEVNSEIEGTVNLEIRNGGEVLASRDVALHTGNNIVSADFEITDPKFWNPNGMGEQHLYKFTAALKYGGKYLSSADQKFGLRNIEVVRDKDSAGVSFYFKVNGVPVFMKGANYIPSDNFLNRVTAEEYEKLIGSAAKANMNMLRVWGGGIYENDIFYDLCDKYGILVWQDFMFACSMYPGDQHFLDNVEQEAVDNVKRLRNHPSLAIWVGNNENEDAWARWGWQPNYTASRRKEIYDAYKAVFFNILPSVIKEYDGSRYYWPSSPSSDFGRPSELKSGDYHYWGVWHGKEPFENFSKNIGRFVSEYGFQSFPELKTVESYTLPGDRDIESEVMAAHQRSGIGNLRIRDYMKMYYRTPKDFENFLYVGQVMQAYGMGQGIEAHRRAMPYCMGSLYWQLDDCWPVASWSGMDYYKRWKALHYRAMHAFEPVLVSPLINNGEVNVYVVSDKLEKIKADLEFAVLDLGGKQIYSKKIPVEIKPNASGIYLTLKQSEILNGADKNSAVTVVNLKSGSDVIAGNLLYFVQPKDLDLHKPSIKMKVSGDGVNYTIELSTDKLAKDVYLTSETDGFFSDNYFDLIPGESRTITFTAGKPGEPGAVFKAVSLIDSY